MALKSAMPLINRGGQCLLSVSQFTLAYRESSTRYLLPSHPKEEENKQFSRSQDFNFEIRGVRGVTCTHHCVSAPLLSPVSHSATASAARASVNEGYLMRIFLNSRMAS